MIQITPIPAFSDNYIWLIKGKLSKVIIVDPGDADPVIEILEKNQFELGGILITHHHHDHCGGISKLTQQYPGVAVYGPAKEKIQGITHPLKENDIVSIPFLDLSFNVLEIPGHTLGHIAYYNDKYLFCGDTLFLCGCGRLFEGTAQQMHNSLSKLLQLDDNLLVYCAHEYTQANLEFSLEVEPKNPHLKERLTTALAQRAQNQPTIPVTLASEKKCNPFLRCHEPILAGRISAHMGRCQVDDPVSVFTQLRLWKDNY